MMETKSHRNGDFELIKYYSSEGPEYLDEGENQLAWHEGRYPKKTGRTIFVITEIYKKKKVHLTTLQNQKNWLMLANR